MLASARGISLRASAYVQWLQLPAAERRAGDGLDAALVEQLAKLERRKDESCQIAARLAARLGLARVHAVDNHTGDHIDAPDIKAFVRSIEAAWATGGAAMRENEQTEAVLAQAADLLPLYRAINDPQQLRVAAEGKVIPSMRAQSKEGQGATDKPWFGSWLGQLQGVDIVGVEAVLK